MVTKDISEMCNKIRSLTSQMFIEEGMGHAGGVYSIIECISVLFAKYIKDDPKDWFVLSKGHAGPAYYAALCVKGKISEEDKNGIILKSKIEKNNKEKIEYGIGSNSNRKNMVVWYTN